MGSRILVIALACMLGAWTQDDKQKEDEAKAKVAEFNKQLRTCKTDTDVANALRALGSMQHPKILAELKKWLTKPSMEISIGAAEQIGRYKNDKDAAETLLGGTNRKEKDVVVKCLRYAGDVGYKGVTAKVAGFFKHREVDVAKEAVDTCGSLKSRDAIEPLIGLLKELDAIKEDKNQPGSGPDFVPGGVPAGAGVADDQAARKQQLTGAVLTALNRITGQSYQALKDWMGWWSKNKATFKDPQ